MVEAWSVPGRTTSIEMQAADADRSSVLAFGDREVPCQLRAIYLSKECSWTLQRR